MPIPAVSAKMLVVDITDSNATSTGPASKRALPAPALAIGDGAVLVLWAVLGLAHHEEGITVAGLARNAGPILNGWFAAALLLGTYSRRRGPVGFALTWLLGISAGVLLRSILLHRAWTGDEFAFYGVTLAVTGLLLAIWRGIALLVARFLPAR
jgi:hypothetical protein